MLCRCNPLPLAAILAAVAACASDADRTTAEGVSRIQVWAHAGQQSERLTLEDQARRFNALNDSIHVELTFLPEGSYNAQVQASAVAGRLPDLLDLDGPYVALYAWQGHLRSLAGLLADAVLSDVLPSIIEQGTWRDRLYAVGTFDSGLALYGRQSALLRAGVEIPRSPAEAWTVAEVSELLVRLAADDADGAVLDLKLNYEGEWFSYAFQPALRSGGGGLVRWEGDEPVAEGMLNGGASTEVLSLLQGWLRAGYVDPNLDDAAFVEGRVDLSWSGHWDYPRYAEALGDDLVILPLPDFGSGTRTGQGSWMWAVPAETERAEAAAAFLSFLLEPDQVLATTRANGAVPGRRTAAESSELYGPGGALRLLVRQLEGGWAVPRPRTPAYPFVSSIFQGVFEAVRNGEALPAELEHAAARIDQEVRDNRGYPRK